MDRKVFDNLPYVARQELIELRSFIQSAYATNAHLIYDDKVDSVLYQFRDYSGQYVFNIQFDKFDPQRHVNVYAIYFKPASLKTIGAANQRHYLTEVKSSFDAWIKIIIKMHEVTADYYDPYRKFYEEQFEGYFKNDDPDSEINPFEIEKQEVLFYFLTYAEKIIDKSSDIDENDKKELLDDLSSLKTDIPTATKKQFVSYLSKFAQKTKKVSNKVFHEIFDVLKKEVIKKILYEAYDHLPMSYIQSKDG